MTSRLGYILTLFCRKFILKMRKFDCMWLALCTAYSSKLNSSVNFEPLACAFTSLWTCMYDSFASARQNHSPNMLQCICCLLSASSLTVTTNQKERDSLCNGWTYFGIGQSPPLSNQCTCIVVMWVGGFGGLMQRSLTRKVHKPVYAAS